MPLVEYLSMGIGFGKFNYWKNEEARLIEDQSDSLNWMAGGDGKFLKGHV